MNIFRQKLIAKILMVLISLVIVSEVLIFAYQGWRFYKKEVAIQINALEELLQVQSLVFARPVWEYDDQEIERLMDRIMRLPMVESIVIYNSNGAVTYTRGNANVVPRIPEFRSSHDILFKTGDTMKYLGSLQVTMNDRNILLSLREYLWFNGLILLTLMVVLIASLMITIRRFISLPLGLLQNSIRDAHSGKQMTKVSWGSDDELGVVVDAYNEMLRAREAAEDSLRRHHETLERQVQERTADLAKAKEDAEAANLAKSAFLANMSHELRSPLTAILGFARVMTRSRTLPREHLENAGIITRSGEHLLTLINQVLDLSKIEAGRTTLNENSFDLHRLLDDTEDLFRMRAEDKHLQLLFEGTPDVPRFVKTDEVKLRQVLINLLNNAVKFTKDGGIAVKVRSENFKERNEESDTSHFSFPTLHFEIEDTGPGIAPDELDRLFEAFAQTKTGRKSQEGTGLGLAISRKFVQLMGGDITVKSEPGRGSVFSFFIRVEKAESGDVVKVQPDRTVIALEPGQPRHRILIVDDNAINRQLLVRLLSSFGFELREAENGKQAVEICGQWSPHLIWMDMRMPVMDGYEAAGKIKETAGGQAVAVIALTASAFEEEKALVLSAGCDDFLRKPYRETEIFETMEKHLGIRFVWEENVPKDRKPEQEKTDKPLTADDLAVLSPELLSALGQGAILGDSAAIGHLIEQIRSSDAPLADAIKALADDFEYDQILKLVTKRGDLKFD